MRAVWVGLVGAVLASGGAQAKSCRLDGAELVAQSQAKWSSEIQRPDLVGRTFLVERIASRWLAPKVAEITVLARYNGEAILVRQVSDFSGPPVDTVNSTIATDKTLQVIRWGQRSPSAERKHFSGLFDAINDGPLVSLGLAAKHCT